MRLEGHVARTEAIINVHSILVGKRERKRLFEDLGVDWRIMLKSILRK
jgi:hypothetical protein